MSKFHSALRHRALPGLVAVATAWLAMPTGTAGAALGVPGISSFAARFDTALGGGVWSLTTQAGASANGHAVLASGVVPADGVVTATVPTAALAQSDTGQFALRAAQILPGAKANVGVRTVGLPLEQLGSDQQLDLGTAATHQVPTYPTVAAAAAAAICGSACEEDGAVAAMPAPKRSRAAAAPTRVAPGQRAAVTKPATVADEPAELPCIATDTCGEPIVVPARNPGDCTAYGPSYYVCTVDARDIVGVQAFRGWSARIAGVTDSFSVETGTQQRWDNGFRVQSGPFSVSGSTVRSKASGGTDTWPLRGDCWTGASQYDQPPCAFSGHESKWGRDTWRWERNINTVCSGSFFPTCNSWNDENLYNKQYDGGTENGNVTSINYNQQPSAIRAGSHGSWSQHLPGSTRLSWMENSTQYNNSASMSVNFPNSYGSATFTSTMSHQDTTKVKNVYTFRSGLPWFTNAPGWPAGTGKWYRYDVGTSWRYEYFACEWGPGWGTGACWANGS